MGWPRQPLTEREPKFNLIFYDSNNIFFYVSKIVISVDKIVKSKDLVDFEELSSDFPGLRHLCSHIDLNSLRNFNGLSDLQSSFFLKKLPDLDEFIPPGTKKPILVPFCGLDHQKSKFLLIFCNLSVRGYVLRPANFTFLKID